MQKLCEEMSAPLSLLQLTVKFTNDCSSQPFNQVKKSSLGFLRCSQKKQKIIDLTSIECLQYVFQAEFFQMTHSRPHFLYLM